MPLPMDAGDKRDSLSKSRGEDAMECCNEGIFYDDFIPILLL